MELVRKNKKNGFIHSKRFPFLKKETIFLFVLEEKSQALVFTKRIVSDEPIITETFQHYFAIDKKMTLKVVVKSDSYIGFDLEKSIELNFLPRREQEQFKIHPDDEKALNEETLFKKMLKEMQKVEDSDDEVEEEEEAQNASSKGPNADGNKKAPFRSNGEDDSEEEEEEEKLSLTKDVGVEGNGRESNN